MRRSFGLPIAKSYAWEVSAGQLTKTPTATTTQLSLSVEASMREPLQTERERSASDQPPRSLVCFTAALLFLALSWLGKSAQADNFVLTTATCPPCTDGQLESWRYAVDNTMGVKGQDPV